MTLTRATVTLTILDPQRGEQVVSATREHDGGGNPSFIQLALEKDLHAASMAAERGVLDAFDRHRGMVTPTPRPMHGESVPTHLLNDGVDWLSHTRASFEDLTDLRADLVTLLDMIPQPSHQTGCGYLARLAGALTEADEDATEAREWRLCDCAAGTYRRINNTIRHTETTGVPA